MKTIVRFIAGLGLFASLVACTKENNGTEVAKSAPRYFIASLDAVNNGLRTSLSGRDVLWSETDKIGVFSGSELQALENPTVSEDRKTATFEGAVIPADKYYVLYPYDAEAVNDNGVITTVLPADQTFTAESFAQGANLSIGSTTDGTISLYNVGGLISFTINEDNVSSVSLTCDEGYLAGKVKIDVTGDEPVVSEVLEGENTVTLSGTFEKGQKYYFAVLPGTFTGLKITIATAGGDVVLNNPVPVTVARNDNWAFGTIAAKLATPSDFKLNQSTFTSTRQKTLLNNVSWSAVNNATAYIVKVDGKEIAVDGLSATLGTAEGTHKITVQAVNTEHPDIYLASDEAEIEETVIFYGGGVEKTPWRIYTAGDWKEFAADCNAYSYSGKFVAVMNDIDFNGETIAAAGLNTSKCFLGTLDGKGKALKNLKLGASDALSCALFVCLNGTVKNLTVDGATVTTDLSAGKTTKGAVIAGGDTQASAKIIGCTVKNSSISCRGYGSMIAACVKSGATEIVGCTVDNCTITGYDAGAGAIAAYLGAAGAKVVDCVVKNSSISAKGTVGSITGSGVTGYIVNCIADTNTLTSTTNSGTGALVGATTSTASAFHIVNNLTRGCKVVNKTNTSEAHLSLLLGRETATAGKVQNNVVVSGNIDHSCTTKPRIGFFVGTKGSGAWNKNYYNIDLVKTANLGTGGDLGPIGNTGFPGAKTGGSTSVGTEAGDGVDVVLSDLVSTLNANIDDNTLDLKTLCPEIRKWETGADGWPCFATE